MRVNTFFRTLRIIAAVTLFFFAWSFLPLYSLVAYAAEPQGQKSEARSQKSGEKQRTETSGDRFEKALDAIRENVAKARDKEDRGEDDTREREAIKAKRADIESADGEFKKEFSATEKKLKDAKLPKEILDRHYKFVKHYESNLKELRANLDGVEQAKTRSDRRAKVEKARLHLEKVKAPSKHQKLDPNNLPFRARKAGKTREPRLRKDEYERDFPKQHKTVKMAELQTIFAAYDHERTRTKNKPFQLAFNGPVSDMPFQLPLTAVDKLPLPSAGEGWGEGAIPNSAFADSSPFLLALAQDAPTADDLAETPEIQFTQDIVDLAAQLGNKPTKIYEWVRNNIEFVPTYGSIQGADMCLQSKQCNDIDTASLLIALLRTSNLPAKYAYGTIEVPIDKAMNWVGGFTDARAAANFLASGNVPVKIGISGSTIKSIQLEHVWVETYIPYGNYRGTMIDDSIKTWIPMDGSFKQYTYTNGFDITTAVPFSQDAYLSQVQSQNAVHYYQSLIQSYLDAYMPDTSIVDVKGYREITQETYHFLPSTLPYITVVQGVKFSSTPANLTATVALTLTNTATGENVSYSATTPELAGKRITVSYLPATSADETLIANYGGFLYDVPAYMLNLKPVLRVEGVIKLTGEGTTLGAEQNLTMRFTQPNGNTETREKKLLAGAYYAIGLDLQGINENVLGKRNYQLNTNVLSETAGTLGNDDLIGEHLFILATTYFLANDKIQKSGAKLFNTAIARTISEGITSFTLTVSSIFGMPKSAMPSGINMDVAMAGVIVSARDGDTSKELAYMDMHGLVGSYNEHDIYEKIDGFSSVSAVKALQTAAAIGISIQKINSSNISQMLPTLQVSSEIITDVQNAVNAGKEVTISQANVQINDWIGAGYILKDTITGAGAYMISGGLSGGDSTTQDDGMQIVEIFSGPLGWILDKLDLLTRSNIAYAAELNIDEIIGRNIVDNALLALGASYEDFDCSWLVRVAYATAGICLDSSSALVASSTCASGNDLATKYGITTGNGVAIFRAIANKQKIRESVRPDKPIIGDMIFFDNTYDENKDCVANEESTHMGIVQKLNIDSAGTMYFIHSSSSKGVVQKKPMNVSSDYKTSTDMKYNTPLRNKYAPCKACGIGENCPGTSELPDGKCSAGSKPACTKTTWDAASPKYSGGLFRGFGTVRANVSPSQ